jgi:putative intracellular protease/amidase
VSRVLIPIPAYDFDPTEVAVSWMRLVDARHEVIFATPDGTAAQGDPLMLTGEGLDLWGRVPGLRRAKVLGLFLRANSQARKAYAALRGSPEFLAPRNYAELEVGAYDALLLPGGHRAHGMRPYLEDVTLRSFVADFVDAEKPFAAICHGAVLAARSVSKKTGRSILYGRKTTGLTWSLERSAWNLMKHLGRVWDANYYRTYLESVEQAPGYCSVQAEVERALRAPSDFLDVPAGSAHFFRKTSGLFRDSPGDSRAAFVVRDGDYVSARWPGDVNLFAKTFCEVLAERGRDPGAKGTLSAGSSAPA